MIESTVDLSLPTITDDLPGFGGELRASPDHFVVEELPLYEPQGEGQHLYVRLTKVGWTTRDVARRLEQMFDLARGAVGYAGMKDKAARTTQTFSLDFGQPHPQAAQAAQAAQTAAERISAELPATVHWARWHRNKLKPGHLLGNRFRITVTQVACVVEEALARGRAVAQRLRQVGLPNYYGPQRFGIGGGNVGQGLEILLGRRQERDRWRRHFMIAAYQSYLCNRYLARRIEVGAFERLLAGDIAKKHATGGLFEVVDLTAEQPRYRAQEISFTAPMFGARLWSATAEAGELEAAVLAATPVTVEHFARARVEGTRRLGRLLLPSLELRAVADGVEVTFELPKGAFATTVLREFMKVDVGPDAAIDEDE